MLLHEIATISSGYSFRTRLDDSPDGGIAVIQMRDLRDDDTVDFTNLLRTDIPRLKPHFHARRGDILLRSRGGAHATAAIIRDNAPYNTIIASPLLIIRVKNPDEVVPGYLHWYLNQSEAQAYIASRTTGTAINIIGKQALAELPVPLPAVEVQDAISELADLAAQEQALAIALAEKQRQVISQTLQHCLEEAMA